jgi:hypothetical protein
MNSDWNWRHIDIRYCLYERGNFRFGGSLHPVALLPRTIGRKPARMLVMDQTAGSRPVTSTGTTGD